MSVVATVAAAAQEDEASAMSSVNGYRILHLLGEGAFSRVYECENGDGHHFAIKVLNKSFLKRKREYKRVDGKLVLSNAFQKVQKEVAIMKKLAHKHLVKLHEVIDSPADDKMFLVLDLICGGQVMDWDNKGFRYHSSRTPKGVLGRSAVHACLRDVVAALDYLHRNRICHRDIKPENILLSSAEEGYKLADFGVAHILEPEHNGDQAMLRSTEGTYHFLAPECTTGDPYDPFQVDIWALGVTMFAMLRGTLPFGAKATSLDAVMASIREDALVLPEDLSPECAELLARMLSKNPSERITIPELLTHPWLSSTAAIPSTPRDGPDAPQAEDAVVVQVSATEIEAAFTPVNNFILMTKLKMKLGSRLARARRSIDQRQDIVGSGGARARRSAKVCMPEVHLNANLAHYRASGSAVTPVSNGMPAVTDASDVATEAQTTTIEGKMEEASPSERSFSKPPTSLGLQKRKSILVETIAGTMDALSTLKPARLLRRNSALGVPSVGTTPLNPETQMTPLVSTSPVELSTKPTVLIGLSSDQPETLGSDPLVAHESSPEAPQPVDEFPDANATECSRLAVVSEACRTADERPVDSQGPQESHGVLQQPQSPRQGFGRRSSTVAARIGGDGESASGGSGPSISDIASRAKIVKRKSALAAISPTKSTSSGSWPRSGSPSKAALYGKLEELLGKEEGALDHQARADASPRRPQSCNVDDSREDACVLSDEQTTANAHEECATTGETDTEKAEVKSRDSLTIRPLATLLPHMEPIESAEPSTVASLVSSHTLDVSGEGNRSPRPQSPRGRRRLSSHPMLQSKLPPLDLSSAPSTPTTRSPVASPTASGSPKRSRRASIDFPLQISEVDELVEELGEPALSARMSPSRRHSLLELPCQGVELPAFTGSLATVSALSSPQTDSTYRSSDFESSPESSFGFDEEVVSPAIEADQENPGSSTVTALPNHRALGPVKPSVSLSTPYLPRYSPIPPPGALLDAVYQDGALPRRLGSSSSTGSLSPHSRLPSPSRFEVPPPVEPAMPKGRPDSATDATSSMIRMSSLAKALDDCLPPDANAAYYSSHALPQASPPVDEAAQDTPGMATEQPMVVDVEVKNDAEPHSSVRATSLRRRSLLETQDSLKLVPPRQSPHATSSAPKRLGWGGRGSDPPPHTSICGLM